MTPTMLCMLKSLSCNTQESGVLSAPGGQTMTAAPSTGPAAGIITAARISTGNLASSEPKMDEPADYNIPDAPDPAGGLLTFIKACIMISQLQGITMTCSKWQDSGF